MSQPRRAYDPLETNIIPLNYGAEWWGFDVEDDSCVDDDDDKCVPVGNEKLLYSFTLRSKRNGGSEYTQVHDYYPKNKIGAFKITFGVIALVLLVPCCLCVRAVKNSYVAKWDKQYRKQQFQKLAEMNDAEFEIGNL